MAKITYTNKVALNENPEIADINKVKDDDMNEIKSVVNTNDDNLGDLTTLTTTTKTSTVAAINELDSVKAEDDIIEISNTQPSSSSNKLWIDTGEIAQAHTEITNEYSTSTGIGYSANYINTKLLDVLGNRTGTYTYSLEGHVSGGGRYTNFFIPFINLNYATDTYTITITAIYQNGAIKSNAGSIDSTTKTLDGVSVSYNTDDTLSNLYGCSVNATLVVS